MEEFTVLMQGTWGPVIIFVLRIFDVSLATVRMLLTVRYARIAVPVIAFFEISIWFIAAGTAFQNLQNLPHFLGYAVGFAVGTAVGMWLEEKLAFGYSTLRIVSRNNAPGILARVREHGFGITQLPAKDHEGNLDVIFSLVPRRQVKQLVQEVGQVDGEAFITIDDSFPVHRGWLYSKRRK